MGSLSRTRLAIKSGYCAYVLYNRDKNKYYVGQSQHVLTRVNQHFTGHGGNGDVYADYKYHDHFEIRIVKFEGSGFRTLNVR